MAKVGIIGTGWGARVQVAAFREAGLEVAGLAGFHRTKTRRAAEELAVAPFDDWRELVNEKAIDLISIVTPPGQHLEMATAALDAKKHVLSEKPTALNAMQAQLLAERASHTDRIAIIDHELRFLPAWRAAREQIGGIGALRYIEVRYSSPSRGDRSREWDWWSDVAAGGGIWGAVGSHHVDTIRYIGFEIEAAQAMLHSTITERPFGNERKHVTSDDFASVNLLLTGGAVAAMTFSAVASGPDEPSVMTIHGEQGAMRLTGEELLMSKERKPFERIAGGDLQQRPGNSPGGAFGSGTLLLGRALRAAIDDGHLAALAPAATFRDGMLQQRVLDAARISAARDGQWQTCEHR